MGNLNDPLQLLRALQGVSRDTKRFTRESPTGRVTDHETIEITTFRNGLPETATEIRTGRPLTCGHVVSRRTPFSGYCTVCGVTTMCVQCELRCQRCSRLIFRCCAVLHREGTTEQHYCKPCRATLRWRGFAENATALLARPFTVEPWNDE